MGAGADAEMDVRNGEFEFIEEPLGHAVIVMLSGMDQIFVEPGSAEGLADGSGL